MSQEAYELLLKANKLFSQNKREEAIKAYREVLRLNPTPNQRQVAEEQLRALGELPYTFVSSGRVIWRQEKKSKGGEQRERTQNRGNRHQERRENNRRIQTRDNYHEKKIREEKSPSTQRKSERVFSVLETNRKPSAIRQRKKRLSKTYRSQEQSSPPKRKSTSQQKKTKAKRTQVNKPKRSNIPPPPKQHFAESDRAYRRRLQRYEIWVRHLQRYPGIDLNTALRLEETGWSLKQLRAEQAKRRREYLKRRREYLESRMQENLTYEGTLTIESWKEQATKLFIWGNRNFVQIGSIAKNELYYLNIRDQNGTIRRYNKLRIEGLTPLDNFEKFIQSAKVEPEIANKNLKVPRNPQERPQIPTPTLSKIRAQQIPTSLYLFSGIILRGTIKEFDPYHILLEMDTETDSHFEVLLFKHALRKLEESIPSNWKSLPNFKQFFKDKREFFPKNVSIDL